MGVALQQQWHTEWTVTPEKISEAIDRIVAAGNPLQIIAYGSRARGDFRPDSDLDLAVILDRIDPEKPLPVRSSIFRGIQLDIDLLVTDKAQFDRFSPWMNTVEYDIAKEGIVLYDRGRDQGANRDALEEVGL